MPIQVVLLEANGTVVCALIPYGRTFLEFVCIEQPTEVAANIIAPLHFNVSGLVYWEVCHIQ